MPRATVRSRRDLGAWMRTNKGIHLPIALEIRCLRCMTYYRLFNDVIVLLAHFPDILPG